VIFSGDHILEKTSPHQAPEQITLSTGLETYLKSLDLVRPLIKDVKFLLGGHENPIYEIEDRIEEIRNVHRERLQLILDLLAKPNSIGEISNSLFGDVEGYTILLALEETGAHIEYLYQHGYLEIVNIEEVTNIKSTVPILFKAVDKKLHSF
jgi:glyoxylase-like metal-dependent hydrolase (beta-lactamase superfamily II)